MHNPKASANTDGLRDIMSHLMFHKAIISDEPDDSERLDTFIDIAQDIMGGHHLEGRSQFEKQAFSVLELVLENHMDPWEIDLIQFSGLYLAKVKKETFVDFITAGKLVFMAWSILKLQSDECLERACVLEEDAEEFFPDDDLFDCVSDLDYTNAVLSAGNAPLTEMIRRDGVRPVTLMELVSAFDEASRESELARLAAERRRFLKMQRDEKLSVEEEVHKENLEDDIARTWLALCEHDEDTVPFSALGCEYWEDTVTAFVALLFLSGQEKVSLSQKEFPHGMIMITNLVPHEQRLMEIGMEAPAVELVALDDEYNDPDTENGPGDMTIVPVVTA